MRYLGLAAGLVLGAGSAGAQDPATGAEHFQTWCASCHGQAAEGNGPMAEYLVIDAPNLQRLAARNGGSFPHARVAWQIDGRDPLLAHGGDMPIYGDFFEGPVAALATEAGQPIVTSQPIVDLITWLESVQEE